MTIRTLTAVAVTLTAGAVFAEEAETAAAEAAAGEEAAVGQKVPSAKAFTVLPFCRQVDGVAEVMAPGATEWCAVAEGKYYPLGSVYRTRGAGSRLVVAFGPESTAAIEGDASFGTRVQQIGESARAIVAGEGTLNIALPKNMQEGAFTVTTPGFTIVNPAGQLRLVRAAKPDGTVSVVRCVTETLALEGRHFAIPKMSAADEICIRETVDNLETLLYGTSGNYVVKIDRGIVQQSEIDEDGNVKPVSASAALEWNMSPKTKVRINRVLPALGERMSVAVMTFDSVGTLKNNFAFTEGRADVNSGELVKPDVPKDAADVKKKAAAEAESDTVTEKPEPDNKKEEE